MLSKIRKPRKESSACSRQTLISRSKCLAEVRQHVSGSGESAHFQAGNEINRMGKEEKETILSSLGLSPDIPPGAGLLLKADVGVTWSTMRKIRRQVVCICSLCNNFTCIT